MTVINFRAAAAKQYDFELKLRHLFYNRKVNFTTVKNIKLLILT